jgi:lipopolysaccharide assembly outer membrane protein LptD (OstA)
MNRYLIKFFLWILLFLFQSSMAFTIQDSTAFNSKNSVSSDTLESDSSRKKSELQGPVHYKADTIEFSIDRKYTYLKGNAEITYQNMKLNAAIITIDWTRSELYARAITDSLDSLGQPVYRGIPTFVEKGNEPMHGLVMKYNFKTRRGKVLEGKTKMDPGYYKGEKINKIGSKTILVRDGYFTSCEYIDHPHYYFYSKKMWVTMNDKLAGRPVVLYIADIPVFYLPAIFMSIRRDRRSGIIMPKYGESAFGGRYLKDFGFYWAINDYMDATFLSTFYDKRGFVFSGNFRYKVRYRLNGNINVDYAPRDVITGEKRQRWRINFRHSQTLSENSTFSASGTFQSDRNFNQNYYDNLDIILNQSLTTTVSFRQRIPSLNSSINISMRRTENLQNGNISQTLPSIQFSLPSRQIGKGGKSWFGTISYNYSTTLESSYNKILQTSLTDTSFVTTKKSFWRHSFNIRQSMKFLKYFTISPSVNGTELWVNETRDYFLVDSTQKLDYVKKPGFAARHTFRASINFKTTLYGLWEIPFGPLKYIRHKLDPSISFSYVPDFSESKYGYVQTFRDTAGNILKGDRFAEYGATPTFKSQVISFSLRNYFQGKMIHPDGTEKKLDLLTWNISTSYNMLADSLNWSDINSSITTSLGKNLRLTGGMVHSLYETRPDGTGRINTFYSQSHRFPFRFVRANASFGFSLNSDMFSRSETKKEKKEEPQNEGEEIENIGGISYVIQENRIEKLRNLDMKWDANFQFSFSYNRSNIFNPVKQLDMQANLNYQLTQNWKIQSRGNFDLIKKEIDYIEFTVLRDLHCWEMNFTWRPAPYSYYLLQIRVKASVLKDLKLTKRSRSRVF